MTRTAEIVVGALLPAEGGLPDGLESGAADFLERFPREAPASMGLALRAALFAAYWVSPVLIGRLPPLSRLAREDRERALAALGKSRVAVLRQLLLLLKATISFQHGADARVRRAIGFPS